MFNTVRYSNAFCLYSTSTCTGNFSYRCGTTQYAYEYYEQTD